MASNQQFTSETSVSQINQILDVIQQNPGIGGRGIADILGLDKLSTLRRYLVFLEREGDISSVVRNNTNCYTIAERKTRTATSKSYKLKPNRHFGRADSKERADAGLPKVEVVKSWVAHCARDPLVTALFGPAATVHAQ